MLTTAPYLRIRRPSPTAAEFTVSTLPPLTLPLRLALYTLYLVRGLLSGLALLLLYTTWAQSPYGEFPPQSPPPPPPPPPRQWEWLSPTHLLTTLLATRIGHLATDLAKRADARISVPVCAAALYACTRRVHAEESLLVLRGLGIQTRSSKGNVLAGRAATRFIPTDKIREVLVNEAFRGFEVRSYLVVVVDGEPDVVVVFPKLLPGAEVVETVWRGVRECLYQRGVGDGVVVDGRG